MDFENMDVPLEMLLHPELLTNEQLLFIIQERRIRIPNVQTMPRDGLLEIFHHYCVPYGQRKYRDSGRGKVLNRTRPKSPDSKSKLNLMDVDSQPSKKKLWNSSERLKPPPDLLSGHMKRIKIDNKQLPTNKFSNLSNNKRKMSVDATPVAESPPCKKEKKPITWP